MYPIVYTYQCYIIRLVHRIELLNINKPGSGSDVRIRSNLIQYKPTCTMYTPYKYLPLKTGQKNYRIGHNASNYLYILFAHL